MNLKQEELKTNFQVTIEPVEYRFFPSASFVLNIPPMMYCFFHVFIPFTSLCLHDILIRSFGIFFNFV